MPAKLEEKDWDNPATNQEQEMHPLCGCRSMLWNATIGRRYRQSVGKQVSLPAARFWRPIEGSSVSQY